MTWPAAARVVRQLGRLGPLEAVFNTSSHHRVHHASNAHHLDRNYAGILMVWDRLFGIFEPEREAPRSRSAGARPGAERPRGRALLI